VKNPQGAYRLLLPMMVVAFIAISIAEVWLLTLVGGWIGVPWTLAILVAEALVGSWLLRREGRKSWSALVAAYQAGRVPTGQLADAALVLVGGIMLILPGFFTDIIGLIFLLPFTRPLARKALGWLVARSVARAGVDVGGLRARPGPGVVPGEVVDQPPKKGDPGPEVISGEIE
jgi:UPF0716 protein FxsA